MINKSTFAAVATGLALAASQAGAVTLTFDSLAEGTTLSTQYAALGAVFTPNAFSGSGSSGSGADWATNTDLTVTATDLGGLGSPSLVSGKLLHSHGGWINENGDPSFKITFSSAVNSISAAFAGVFYPEDVHLIAFNGSTQLADITSSVTTGQFTLSYTAPLITSVIITPGTFDDWVGVDNISYTIAAVPEASTYAMMALGLGVLVFRRRRQD